MSQPAPSRKHVQGLHDVALHCWLLMAPQTIRKMRSIFLSQNVISDKSNEEYGGPLGSITENISVGCHVFMHPEKIRANVHAWAGRHFVMSTRRHENSACAAGDRKACRHAQIMANMKQQRTETSFRFFHQSYPDIPLHTVADTWIDSFQVH